MQSSRYMDLDLIQTNKLLTVVQLVGSPEIKYLVMILNQYQSGKQGVLKYDAL